MIISSRHEGNSNVAGEALLVGLPVATTDCGAIATRSGAVAGALCGASYWRPWPLRPSSSKSTAGPDSRGTFLEDGVGLGIQRLAIIDLETGDQPIFNEDGSVVVVLNGEIYNYRELRERAARGPPLRDAQRTPR